MRMKISAYGILACLLTLFCGSVAAQKVKHYNLAELLRQNRIDTTLSSNTQLLSDGSMSNAISSVNRALFKDLHFSEGIIDIDLRGKDHDPRSKNEFPKSFLGIMFYSSDTMHFEVLYFRPFNFRQADTIRQRRSIQYMSIPDSSFVVLRNARLLEFENKLDPVPDPDGWFHATIHIENGALDVYVNHSKKTSLHVRLLGDRKDGLLGLFSDGLRSDFANLSISPLHH
jgi:hypothetical protein